MWRPQLTKANWPNLYHGFGQQGASNDDHAIWRIAAWNVRTVNVKPYERMNETKEKQIMCQWN